MPTSRTLARATRALAALAALAVLTVTAAPAAAQRPTPLALGVWTEFSWFDGVGSFTDPSGGFFLDAVQPVRLRLTDAFSAGDAFDLFVNGVWALGTPDVASDEGVDAATGAAAWADPRLSRGMLTLGAGRHALTIQLRSAAEGWTYGSGFVRADLVEAPVTTVPEPATTALLGAGLLALGGAAARRRRACEAGR